MPDRCLYDYAVIRVVPRVEREEFVNAGIILSCPAKGFLDARFALDEARIRALDPVADMATIRAHLDAIAKICAGSPDAGPIGRLPKRERFHWLVAPRSTVIQPSPSHTGLTSDPAGVLDRLMKTMVLPPT